MLYFLNFQSIIANIRFRLCSLSWSWFIHCLRVVNAHREHNKAEHDLEPFDIYIWTIPTTGWFTAQNCITSPEWFPLIRRRPHGGGLEKKWRRERDGRKVAKIMTRPECHGYWIFYRFASGVVEIIMRLSSSSANIVQYLMAGTSSAVTRNWLVFDEGE